MRSGPEGPERPRRPTEQDCRRRLCFNEVRARRPGKTRDRGALVAGDAGASMRSGPEGPERRRERGGKSAPDRASMRSGPEGPERLSPEMFGRIDDVKLQ